MTEEIEEGVGAVGYAAFEWIDWFNNRRRHVADRLEKPAERSRHHAVLVEPAALAS